MNNRRFYIVAGIVLAGIIGLLVLSQGGNGNDTPADQDDTGLRLN